MSTSIHTKTANAKTTLHTIHFAPVEDDTALIADEDRHLLQPLSTTTYTGEQSKVFRVLVIEPHEWRRNFIARTLPAYVRKQKGDVTVQVNAVTDPYEAIEISQYNVEGAYDIVVAPSSFNEVRTGEFSRSVRNASSKNSNKYQRIPKLVCLGTSTEQSGADMLLPDQTRIDALFTTLHRMIVDLQANRLAAAIVAKTSHAA